MGRPIAALSGFIGGSAGASASLVTASRESGNVFAASLVVGGAGVTGPVARLIGMEATEGFPPRWGVGPA